MARDLIVRGFDDKIYSNLGEIAKRDGVSLNSIVKDAVDKWVDKNQKTPKKHDLILYDDDNSIQGLIKSIDSIAKTGGWFRSFCGPTSNKAVQLLSKLKWFNATISPYNVKRKDIGKYCGQVMERVSKQTKKKEVCCMDFILGDVAHNDFKLATKLEKNYNSNRITGMMFCPYKTESILGAGISDMMELFEQHDQIFILKDDELHKLHVTNESVHKLFLN